MKLYELGIVPCTKTKNPTAQTAQTLYRGGPFSLMMRHAVLYCERVIIMSAKHGLLDLNEKVTYYDAYLPNLSRSERDVFVNKLSDQLLKIESFETLSYLPKVYFDACCEALPQVTETWHRPFKHLPMHTCWKVLSEEIAAHGKSSAGR